MDRYSNSSSCRTTFLLLWIQSMIDEILKVYILHIIAPNTFPFFLKKKYYNYNHSYGNYIKINIDLGK